MIRYIFMSIGIVILISVIVMSCEPDTYPRDHEQLSDDERLVIRFSHVVGENTPKGLASRRFAELVYEKTDGYVEVQVFPNSKLYKDGEELDALRAGDVHIITPAITKITEFVPEWQVLDLPFAFNTIEEVKQYIKSPVGRVLTKKLEEKDMYLLSFWPNGFKQMSSELGPLKHPDDFSGLKFRIMPSQILQEQFKLLNATTSIESFDRVYAELESQKVNSQENTLSNIVNKGLYRLQNHLTISNHGFIGYFILINASFWNELPDDVKVAVLESLEEVKEWQEMMAEQVNEESYQLLKDCHCINIHELSEAEKVVWKQHFAPLYNEFSKKYGSYYLDNLPKSYN